MNPTPSRKQRAAALRFARRLLPGSGIAVTVVNRRRVRAWVARAFAAGADWYMLELVKEVTRPPQKKS